MYLAMKQHNQGRGGAAQGTVTTNAVQLTAGNNQMTNAVPAPQATVVTTQQMDVVVPAGLVAGQAFTVGTPSGNMQAPRPHPPTPTPLPPSAPSHTLTDSIPEQITVPAGCGPGSTLRMDVPQQAVPQEKV